jgi:large subunit ribosomal protein L24e
MECSFCGRDIRRGLDSIYVTSKGRMHHFCSSKCEKNMLKLKRNVRKVKWTKAYRREKEARLKLLKEGLRQEEIKRLQEKPVEKEVPVEKPRQEEKVEQKQAKPEKEKIQPAGKKQEHKQNKRKGRK